MRNFHFSTREPQVYVHAVNMIFALLATLALFALPANPLPAAESGGRPLYLDPAQSLDKRVQDFIARLTLTRAALSTRGAQRNFLSTFEKFVQLILT